MANPKTQRRYSAPCPGCGAPVAFSSAQSTHAVCAYCHSSVVRRADQLARLGRIADEFVDYSPLKLGDTGQWDGRTFTLIGRLQFGYDNARWTDWQAAFDDGSLASLSEDNGSFVFSKQVAPPAMLPAFDAWRLEQPSRIGRRQYTVTLVKPVSLLAAGGELGHLPSSDKPFGLVELRSEDGWVCSIEFDGLQPSVWVGQAVELSKLGLGGSAEPSERKDEARHFNCPKCAARLEIKLDTTQSIGCPSCNSVIDVSQGIGGELRHAIQSEPVRPVIPLGSVGTFDNESWQAVGFQHRTGKVEGEEEWFGWTEYLLYNRKLGFAFLVNSSEGWSWAIPLTGAPTQGKAKHTVNHMGKKFSHKERYPSRTEYVAGEFYWQVRRGEEIEVHEFKRGPATLTREKADREVTWSLGKQISSDAVGKGFGLSNNKAFQAHTDTSPTSLTDPLTALWEHRYLLFVAVLVFAWLSWVRTNPSCDPQKENCQSASYRTSGGSFGGSSRGGWHK